MDYCPCRSTDVVRFSIARSKVIEGINSCMQHFNLVKDIVDIWSEIVLLFFLYRRHVSGVVKQCPTVYTTIPPPPRRKSRIENACFAPNIASSATTTADQSQSTSGSDGISQVLANQTSRHALEATAR